MGRLAQAGLRGLYLLAAGGSLLQIGGCARIITQELEVLFAADANPTLVGGSILAGLLGRGILTLFN